MTRAKHVASKVATHSKATRTNTQSPKAAWRQISSAHFGVHLQKVRGHSSGPGTISLLTLLDKTACHGREWFVGRSYVGSRYAPHYTLPTGNSRNLRKTSWARHDADPECVVASHGVTLAVPASLGLVPKCHLSIRSLYRNKRLRVGCAAAYAQPAASSQQMFCLALIPTCR
jgi:hypothetical protein